MSLPHIPTISYDSWPIPDRKECQALWEEYRMPEHIRKHSQTVSKVAVFIGRKLRDKGIDINLPLLKASALLHDIGKAYCIKHGGAHSQVGASIVIQHTSNPLIAMAVMHHVFWPDQIDIQKYFLPLTIIYSDKRVKHDQVVDIDKRFVDLFDRYGLNDKRIKMIQNSKNQVKEIETELSKTIGVNLNACSFDSRRLVQ